MANHPPIQVMRSFRRDPEVTQKKLAKGTVRRIFRFAAPYKKWLITFLVIILVDAVVGVVNPLILKKIIDDGVAPGKAHGDPGLVLQLAIIVAVLALVDAGLTLWQRWYSARIGEGLIYDMRVKVFDHVQRMPIAFFTRTQTGALISRLNNDVLGAQQAFTGTMSSVVSNFVSVVLVITAMLTLSWQITVISLIMLPIFVIPARLMGRKLQEITREGYGLNAQMNTTMTERFNVSGALLVKLFGRPGGGDRPVRPPGRAGARHRRPVGHVLGHLLRRAEPGGGARDGDHVRHRRAPWPPSARCRSAPSSR